MRSPTFAPVRGPIRWCILALSLGGALSCASAREPGKVEPIPQPADSAHARQAPRPDTVAQAPAPAPAAAPTPAPAPAPIAAPEAAPAAAPAAAPPAAPAPAPVIAPEQQPAPSAAPAAAAAKPKPKPNAPQKPAPVQTGPGRGGPVPKLALPPVVVHAKPKPAPVGLTRRERFVRDSIARAAAERDSLARAQFASDSIARVIFVRDSIRAAFVRDSVARAAFVRDSLTRIAFVRDSVAHAAFVQESLSRVANYQDSLRRAAESDSAYGPDGGMPRIQNDPNVQRPTAAVELDYYEQVQSKGDYWQLVLSYARPFAKRSASWEIDVPFQYWMSIPRGTTVTGPANISLIVNRRISAPDAKWRQIVSLTLNPNSSVVNDTIGNNQWYIQPQFALSRWFASDRLQARMLLYWQYGFRVDSGTTKKNVLVPRLVLNGVVTKELNGGIDYRPRFDFTRNEFYSTLQFYASYAISNPLGLQAGYEFPLDSLAKKRVEVSKTYLVFSMTF